jgi:DNA repair exonuclease SbcCD ATPase subunit
MDLEQVRRNLERKKALRAALLERLRERRLRLDDAIQRAEDAETARKALQEIAEEVQNFSHRRIGEIVSRCLSAVFEKDIELRIEFEQKRGKTEAEFVYYEAGQRINPRVSSGAMLQVSALALRLAAIMLSHPGKRRLLVLDEPFVGMDAEKLPRIASLIETLSEELGMQFLIATHLDQLKIGKVIRL